MNALLIFLGGGLGALSRYGLSTGLDSLLAKTSLGKFPVGIFACNLLGCFFIGCVFGYFVQKQPAWIFPLLVTGFLGGFTTFSTFGRDSFNAFQSGLPLVGTLNIALSVLLGVLAVWLGLKVGTAAPTFKA